MVSELAEACPSCGAPIAVIKASNTPKTNTPALDCRTFVLRIQSDVGAGLGVALEQNGKRFLVFDEALADGAETLQIFPATTNIAVDYRSFEVADDRPLVRFFTQSTNIVPLPWPAETAELNDETSVISVLTNRCIVTNVSKLTVQSPSAFVLNERITNLVCALVGTNVLVIAQAGSDRFGIALSPAVRWNAVTPREFRRQTRLLRDGESPAFKGDTDKLIETLRKTDWLCQNFRDRAAAAIKSRTKSVKDGTR